MTITITPEYVMKLGEDVRRIALDIATPEELIAHLTPEQRLAGLKLEERVAGLAVDDLLSHLSFEEIEAYLEEHRPKPTDKESPQK